jgi:NAD(P)-dependent dehydrogenase (short-subunit alcohol dehydrogenase family)
MLFGKLGASVVVNDPGSDVNGNGGDRSVADKVCDEVRALGGKAVANYAQVQDDPEGIIDTAIKSFGRIDVLVSNAGSLRDKTLARMSDADFQYIQEVHVHGMYRVVRAAWTHMTKQGFGRIVCTASASGTYGNFGQVNYSGAKMATVGFVKALAPLGRKKGITVNALCPQAGTRMLTTIPGMDLKEIGRWTPVCFI